MPPPAPGPYPDLWGAPTKVLTLVCPSLVSAYQSKLVWALPGAGAGCSDHLRKVPAEGTRAGLPPQEGHTIQASTQARNSGV